MLVVQPREKRKVKNVVKLENQLVLDTDYGCLVLQPKSDTIIRIVHTLDETKSIRMTPGMVDTKEYIDWKHEETEKEVIILTSKIKIKVNKTTSSICYYDKENNLILSEKDKESHLLEQYDAYRVIDNDNTQVRIIDTPDGKKTVANHMEKVFDKKLYRTSLHFKLHEDEALYGLGQREDGAYNLRDKVCYMHQANMKIAIPFIVSTKGYGLLVDTYAPFIFEDNKDGTCIHTEADEALEYYFIAGDNFDQIISGYRFLTGKATMLPRWTFGLMQSLERYETGQEMLDTIAEYRRREIGVDSIVLDWQSWEGEQWGQKSFDYDRFPNPRELTDKLHENHSHMMISIWPNMAQGTENYEEMKQSGHLLPNSNCYNAFSKEARNMYWNQANSGLFQYGIDSWWCDSSEGITPEWCHRIKPSDAQMYAEFYSQCQNIMPQEAGNAYGLFHAIGIYEGQRSVTDKKRVVNLTRSVYTGGQRLGTILWSGDISATWETLKNQIAAGLSFCISGLPYWTLDIGGFFTKKGVQWFWNGDYDLGNLDFGYRELFTRWYQFGAFLPIFRVHGTDARREIWHFGEEGSMFYDAMVTSNRLRYQLIPSIYSWAGRVWKENYTILRLLAFDFKEDKNVHNISDQFMFGDSLMICPVTNSMYYDCESVELHNIPKERKVYLPKGNEWQDYWTGIRYHGGQTIIANAPISHIPLYIKCGSILFTGNAVNYVDENKDKPINVNIYEGMDVTTLFYDDKGDGYGYESGEYYTILFEWIDKDEVLIIHDVEGSYWDIIGEKEFIIKVHNKVEPIVYYGKKMIIDFRRNN